MNELQWMSSVRELLQNLLLQEDHSLIVEQGRNLAYAYEIVKYGADGQPAPNLISYETDILVSERRSDGSQIPRVIIELKVGRITSHDAITYSEKASNHKKVHPYLRYGIMIGARMHYPLPGRLFRHGEEFDFMLSWQGEKPESHEELALKRLVRDEVNASRLLEEMFLRSRSPRRKKYYVLHKPLRVALMGKEYSFAEDPLFEQGSGTKT